MGNNDGVFQIICVKPAVDDSGRIMKDKDGKPLVADKKWRGPSGDEYLFCKRGNGKNKSALLKFSDAAKALTYTAVFAPGEDCKNEDLLAIYSQAKEAADRTAETLKGQERAKQDRDSAMSQEQLKQAFVSKHEFLALVDKVEAMSGELDALNEAFVELKGLVTPLAKK
jgi:hypothetical protein